LPAFMLRRIITLQNELTNLATEAVPGNQGLVNPVQPNPPVANPAARAPAPRPLLSAGFGDIAQPLNHGARAVGRNIISAGDRLREMIVPDALVAAVFRGAGVGRIPNEDAGKANKLREEMEEMLAGSCPLCESVIVGLDRPFVKEGEVDTAWEL